MNCPHCSTPLQTHEIHGVRCEECPSCRGFWIPGEGIENAIVQSDADAGWLDFEVWKDHEEFSSRKTELACPACGQAMVSLTYGDGGRDKGGEQGEDEVRLETCPSDRGVWFDARELERLLQVLRAEVSRKPSLAFLRDALEEAFYILSHPRSLPREWEHWKQIMSLLRLRIFVEHPTLVRSISDLQGRTPLT